MVLIPFSFSITQGILWGLFLYGFFAIVARTWKQQSSFFKGLWFLAILLITLENLSV